MNFAGILLRLIILLHAGLKGMDYYSSSSSSWSVSAMSVQTDEVKSEPPACTNRFGDGGVCLNAKACLAKQGIPIGPCAFVAASKARDVCCMLDLSCPKRSAIEKKVEMMGGKLRPRHIRSASSVEHPFQAKQSSPPPPPLECGPASTNRSTDISREPLLVGGMISATRHPWLVALWIRYKEKNSTKTTPICGATPISGLYVMTVAHCCARDDLSYFVRGATNTNLEGFGEVRDVVQVTPHPKFDPNTFENDIAVLRLDHAFIFNAALYPACLPPPLNPHLSLETGRESTTPIPVPTSYAGQIATLAGWGCLKETCGQGEVPVLVRAVSMPIISNQEAMCWFNEKEQNESGQPEYIPERVFLVGGDASGSVSPCRGDSGSPVVLRADGDGDDEGLRVVGMVSWSKGCGRPLRPSVWTRVETFVEWVVGVVQEGGDDSGAGFR